MIELLQPYLPTIIGSLLSGIFAINVLFFRWLMSTFANFRADLRAAVEVVNKVQETFMRVLANHEAQDQQRHEENLYRFEKVAVALARLGSSNGTHEKSPNG